MITNINVSSKRLNKVQSDYTRIFILLLDISTTSKLNLNCQYILSSSSFYLLYECSPVNRDGNESFHNMTHWDNSVIVERLQNLHMPGHYDTMQM